MLQDIYLLQSILYVFGILIRIYLQTINYHLILRKVDKNFIIIDMGFCIILWSLFLKKNG